MGFELLNLYRELEFDIDLQGAMWLQVSTEVPGGAVLSRFTKALSATSGRSPVNVRLPGDSRGKFIKLKLWGPNVCILYGAKVYAKPLQVESAWAWYPLPLVPTRELYTTVALPILPTPDGYGDVRLPIAATPEGYGDARLPIAATPEGYGTVQIPGLDTPGDPGWVDLPLDTIE